MIFGLTVAVKKEWRHAGRYKAILRSGNALPDHDGCLICYGVVDHNALQTLQKQQQCRPHIIEAVAQGCCLLL